MTIASIPPAPSPDRLFVLGGRAYDPGRLAVSLNRAERELGVSLVELKRQLLAAADPPADSGSSGELPNLAELFGLMGELGLRTFNLPAIDEDGGGYTLAEGAGYLLALSAWDTASDAASW